jgi:hypothetical protein
MPAQIIFTGGANLILLTSLIGRRLSSATRWRVSKLPRGKVLENTNR